MLNFYTLEAAYKTAINSVVPLSKFNINSVIFLASSPVVFKQQVE